MTSFQKSRRLFNKLENKKIKYIANNVRSYTHCNNNDENKIIAINKILNNKLNINTFEGKIFAYL